MKTMSREEAIVLLKEHVKNKNLLNHMYAVEAVMKDLAEYFQTDEELWAMTGLLHDIDYDQTKEEPSRHSIIGSEILAEIGFEPELVYAVKCHNAAHGLERNSLLDKALYATDPLTGLIVASALIRPEKRIEALDVPFIMKKFSGKSFARGANREQICCCSELGLELDEFIGIGLEAMKKIHKEIGL